MKTLIRFLLRHVPRPYLQKLSRWGRPLLALLYCGRRVSCPVCGRSFRRFLPYGHTVMRKNALCPACLSLERHRMIWFCIRRTALLSSHANVLHVAPEHTFIRKFKQAPHLNYITGDLESPWADVRMDIRDIPFRDGFFDFIMCNHVLEHIEDDTQAMRELFRVLKPGGWGIISVPLNTARAMTYEDPSVRTPEERERCFGQRDHVREYGCDFPERLRACGFIVEELDDLLALTPAERTYYGLLCEPLYRVSK